jgi:hypothetical protein
MQTGSFDTHEVVRSSCSSVDSNLARTPSNAVRKFVQPAMNLGSSFRVFHPHHEALGSSNIPFPLSPEPFVRLLDRSLEALFLQPR